MALSPGTVRRVSYVVRIRLSLADRAGALGQAATVIGLHSGNIISVDVHSTEDGAAVDDILVEFPDQPSLEELSTDLTMNAAATIVHVEASRPGDVLTSVLTALLPVRMAATEPSVSALIEAATLACPSTAWAVAAPGTHEPSDAMEDLVVPLPQSGEVLVGRREAAGTFTATETARVEAIVRFWSGPSSVPE